jgi:hypothetical protein
MLIKKFTRRLRDFLDRPRKVFVICSVVVLCTLLLNGTFIRLWSLHVDADRKLKDIAKTHIEVQKYKAQLEQAKDPSYIERLAKDKFDLAGENDLVFVFPAE